MTIEELLEWAIAVKEGRGMKAPAPFVVRVDDVAADGVRVIGETLPSGVTGKAKDAERFGAERKRIANLEAEIVRAVLESKQPITGGKGIEAALRGSGVAFRNGELRAAAHNVLQSGRVANVGTLSRPRWVKGAAA